MHQVEQYGCDHKAERKIAGDHRASLRSLRQDDKLACRVDGGRGEANQDEHQKQGETAGFAFAQQ